MAETLDAPAIAAIAALVRAGDNVVHAGNVRKFATCPVHPIDEKHPEIWKTIREKKAITDDFKPAFEAALKTFTDGFVASKG